MMVVMVKFQLSFPLLACIYNKLSFNIVIITQTNNYLQPNQIAEIDQNEKLQNWGRKFRKI